MATIVTSSPLFPVCYPGWIPSLGTERGIADRPVCRTHNTVPLQTEAGGALGPYGEATMPTNCMLTDN